MGLVKSILTYVSLIQEVFWTTHLDNTLIMGFLITRCDGNHELVKNSWGLSIPTATTHGYRYPNYNTTMKVTVMKETVPCGNCWNCFLHDLFLASQRHLARHFWNLQLNPMGFFLAPLKKRKWKHIPSGFVFLLPHPTLPLGNHLQSAWDFTSSKLIASELINEWWIVLRLYPI